MPGNLFVAVPGARTDGHRFVDAAIARYLDFLAGFALGVEGTGQSGEHHGEVGVGVRVEHRKMLRQSAFRRYDADVTDRVGAHRQ